MSAAAAPEPLWPRFRRAGTCDVVGVGQISLDSVWVCAEPLGVALEPPERASLPQHPGGQVATALLAAARLGLAAAYVGAVGDDAAADAAVAPLRAAGVDLSGVKACAGGRTRRALIRVEQVGGEREVTPLRDPRVRIACDARDRARIASARALLVDSEDPDAAIWAAGVANAAGVPVVMDAHSPGAWLADLLPRVDFPIVSRLFAEALEQRSAREGLVALASRSRALAVVTLGEGGAMALARGGDRVLVSPGFRVEARDTTGAGDAFHAGFIWGLLRGLDVALVLRTANAVAALACTALGAQAGLPGPDAVEALLREERPERRGRRE